MLSLYHARAHLSRIFRFFGKDFFLRNQCFFLPYFIRFFAVNSPFSPVFSLQTAHLNSPFFAHARSYFLLNFQLINIFFTRRSSWVPPKKAISPRFFFKHTLMQALQRDQWPIPSDESFTFRAVSDRNVCPQVTLPDIAALQPPSQHRPSFPDSAAL